MRLLLESLTKRLPAVSSASAAGPHRLSGPIPLTSPAICPLLQALVVKLRFCPNTSSASVSPAPLSPLVELSGVLYSSTRLLPVSATKRLAAASSATARGSHRLSRPRPAASPATCPPLHTRAVKLPFWPKTIEAG